VVAVPSAFTVPLTVTDVGSIALTLPVMAFGGVVAAIASPTPSVINIAVDATTTPILVADLCPIRFMGSPRGCKRRV
jgi:hypothetical protein